MQYVFNKTVDVYNLLLKSIPQSVFMKTKEDDNIYRLFHNGDILKINLTNGTMESNFITENTLSGSILRVRLNQWFSKGIIFPASNN